MWLSNDTSRVQFVLKVMCPSTSLSDCYRTAMRHTLPPLMPCHVTRSRSRAFLDRSVCREDALDSAVLDDHDDVVVLEREELYHRGQQAHAHLPVRAATAVVDTDDEANEPGEDVGRVLADVKRGVCVGQGEVAWGEDGSTSILVRPSCASCTTALIAFRRRWRGG